jgi:hypothetical protein
VEEVRALRGTWTTGGGTEQLRAERQRERELGALTGDAVMRSVAAAGHTDGMARGADTEQRGAIDEDPARRAAGIKALRGIRADTAGGTEELLAERRRERELEERKAGRWGVGRSR